MFCSKCGKEIPEDSKFCQFCGNNFNENKNIVKNTTSITQNPIFRKIMRIIGITIIVMIVYLIIFMNMNMGRQLAEATSGQLIQIYGPLLGIAFVGYLLLHFFKK
jgi:uncharacterized membrane protein YvbJ